MVGIAGTTTPEDTLVVGGVTWTFVGLSTRETDEGTLSADVVVVGAELTPYAASLLPLNSAERGAWPPLMTGSGGDATRTA